MPDEKDLSLKKNNNFIPRSPQASDEEIAGGDFVPEHMRTPREPGFILAKLEDNDFANVGGIIISRVFKHENGSQGGEAFRLEADGFSKQVELTDLAALTSEAELKELFSKEEE